MNTGKKGIFVTFEGGEASGKTTQIRRLAEKLKTLHWPVLTTREPGGTPIGEAIRKLLAQEWDQETVCSETELLLFEASRAQLVRTVLQPALARGDCVLCDRFADSTRVYQGVARQLSTEIVAQLNNFATGSLQPDLTFVLDLPAQESFRRVQARKGQTLDRIERENLDFYEQVRAGYLRLAEQDKHRFVRLDGLKEIAALAQEIWTHFQQRFPEVCA